MVVVQTVLGPISPEELGITLTHEHVVSRFNPKLETRQLDYAIRELKKARMFGASTLVEVSPPNMHLGKNDGRNIPVLQEVSRKSGVNIICSTGYYEIPPAIKNISLEEIAESMVNELTQGANGTNIRPGVIKIAANYVPLQPLEEKIFVAAGMAQAQTGAPICCHTETGLCEQLEALLKGGANPDHCYFSHVEVEWGWEGRSLEEEAKYLLDIVQTGASLCINDFGFTQDLHYGGENDLAYLIKFMIDNSAENKVLISMDCVYEIHDDGYVEFGGESVNPEVCKRNYAFLFTHTIPMLVENGIDNKSIHTILVDNTKRILTPFKS